MDIPTVQNQQGGRAATQNNLTNQSLGKQEFLQLLVAQLQNQDPINPMDSKEFASQLAQFNSVEQLINLNDGVQNLAQSQQLTSSGLTNTMAASLTGKTVRALSDKVALEAGESSEVNFRLNNIASEVEITVFDSSGNVMRTETLENIGRGDHTWEWDGKTSDGRNVPEGTYRTTVTAKNGDEESSALTFVEGIAEKVRFSQNGAELIVNGIKIPLGDVEEIGIQNKP